MKNLLIAGIGGQGINSLASVLAKVFHGAGLACQYTVHKGGAQSLGSVYAELRIAAGDRLPVLGPGIPPRKLDILVAMDPWEALRHLPLVHAGSRCFVETEIMPLFTDRSRSGVPADAFTSPIDQLTRLPLSIVWRNYRQEALSTAGKAGMANYFAGVDCLTAMGLFQKAGYDAIFFGTIPGARQGKTACN